MRQYILFIALFLLTALRATAQDADKTHQQLPALTADYYDGVTFLKQNYNYELANKKRQLKRISNDVLFGGVILAVMGNLAISYVGAENGWSLAVSIPAGVAVAGAILWPTGLWGDHLRKKADAIEVETAYVLPVGGQTQLGAAVFHNSNEHSLNAIGIGLKTTF